jgi:hypothetical protein
MMKLGDLIQETLKKFGYTQSDDCGCASLQKTMNDLGPSEARRSINSLATSMCNNARSAGFKCNDFVARQLILWAIRKVEKQ